MNTARSANQFRLLVLIALITALALASFWMLEVMRKSANDATPDKQRNTPDYYVEKFNFVRMSKTGQAQYNIAGDHLTHNPGDDSFEIRHPDINSLSKERPPMTMRAERAIVDHDNTQIHMYDKVRVDRAASADSEPFHLKSEYLLLLPNDDVMQTDKPAHMTLGASILTGTGMWANNATRELRVAQNVHITYPPAAR